ncbi:MAG TPA: hypothetical protein VMN82_17440 [Thermoanaerobaculia bacterium]|nr:hypothetical protein [Thermoanaerobaculia bacterium]
MKFRWTLGLAILGVVALLGAPAVADDKTPDGTVKISEGSVAVGIGWSWGRGDLTTMGKTYHFKIDGLSVAEVGVTSARATGTVYNLKNIADFDGVYAAAGAEGTAGKGAGVSSLRNSKGVVINLKSETKGASIKIAASGLKVTLEK